MRSYCLAFVVSTAVAAVLPAAAAEIEAKSQIDAVTVYPDGASVTRLIRLDLPAGDNTLLVRDFPLTLDPSSLRVEGEGGARLVIGAVDARPPQPAAPANLPDIDKRIEALRDQRAALDGEIETANARRKFVERLTDGSLARSGEKGEARPVADWKAAFAVIADEIVAIETTVRGAKIKQRDIDRSLAVLEAQRNAAPPKKLEVRIDMNADAPAPALLRVTYMVRGARWTPVYDARLDTGNKDRKPSLDLLRRAEIVQNTGEDWADVALAVSTVRTGRGGSAPELRPLIVRYPVVALDGGGRSDRSRLQYAPAAVAALDQDGVARSSGTVRKNKAEEQQTEIDANGFQVVFRVPGRIAVVAGQGAKSFRLASATIAPELTVHAVPSLAETAFLEASFKHAEDAPLLPGQVSIYRDGIFVGKSPMALLAKDETVRLGFGVDEKVKVARTVVRRSEGTAGLIGSSRTDEREFKTVIRNSHDFAIRVAIEDQIPVSEIEEIQVEMLPLSTQPTTRDLRDRRGVMEWAFDVKPGESRDIKLGWRLRWPKDKAVQLSGSAS